jgi:regulator of protease activity HflC (stomatin/prohibitin superfamily)
MTAETAATYGSLIFFFCCCAFKRCCCGGVSGAWGKEWISSGLPPLKDGTTLVELDIKYLADAHKFVGQKPGGYTPVVIQPHDSSKLCCCFVSIPEGFAAMIRTVGGAHVPGDEPNPPGGENQLKTWTPGLKILNPLHSVQRLVSTATFVFDTPVKECLTKDYTSVSIDVLIIFTITDPITFVTNLGPEKLDALMCAAKEEVVRQLASTRAVTEMFDLFGRNSEDVVADMNKNLQAYGVLVKFFTLRQVTVPDAIVDTLEMTTLTNSKEKRLEVQEKAEDQKGKFDEEKARAREASENKTLSAEQIADFAKRAVGQELLEVEAMTEKATAEREAEMKAAVEELNAQADLSVAKLEAATLQIDREITASTQGEVAKMQAQAEAYKRKKQAEALVAASKLRSEGLGKLYAAEGDAGPQLAPKRQFEVASRRLDVIEGVAENPMVRIASSDETALGLAPGNSLVARTAQAGMEAMQAQFGEIVETSRAPATQRM